MSGNFLSCLKGVKYPFKAQEETWDFSRDTAVERVFISRLGENLLGFLELWQETWGSSRVATRTSNLFVLRGASWDSFPVSAGA